MTLNSPLVSSEWLKNQLNNPDLLLLDASMTKTVSGSDVTEKVYIPNSQHFDFSNRFCDTSATISNMFPSPEIFNRELQILGVNNNSIIVVYDTRGIYSSPRVWWMLKCMSFDNVYILNGGLPDWQALGYPLVDELASMGSAGNFIGEFNKSWIISADEVLAQIDKKESLVIDVREEKRFAGVAAEPREGLRSGHIPLSVNIPFSQVLKGHHYADVSEIRRLFKPLNIDAKQKLIFSCGSGVTACIVLVAAHLLGYRQLSVYDGSWSEWGAELHFPISKTVR
jgi:thiosulfate/3-mercaptopyruvate sulfurtransferase